MKTKRIHYQAGTQGSVLVVSLGILAVAAILLGSYLTMVQTQTNSVARSQTWNSAMALTEAGLEEGMARVNKGSPSLGSNNNIISLNGGYTIINSAWDWTNYVALDGLWSSFDANGKSVLQRTVYTNNSGPNGYTVTIDISSGTPTITAAGYVSFTTPVWASYGAPQPFLAAAGVSTAPTGTLNRKIQVQTVLNPLFTVGILTRSNFNMNGKNCVVDSFDSSNTNASSTNGQWILSKRRANGSVATDSGVVGDINVGNGTIYGHVYTGPGTSQSAVQLGPQGGVGDVAWNASNTGIETNYWLGNFNTAIPDVLTPTFSGTALPSPDTNGNIVVNGGNYITTASGAPNKPLIISGPTTLWVQGGFSPPAMTFTNGGSLILYVGTATGSGDTLDLSGNDTVNMPGKAGDLQIYGLPSLTKISLTGNAGFIGTIYAPEADVKGGGGGNNTLDTSGAMVVNSVTLNGHWNFHYDEHLLLSGASRGWIAKNWTEINN